MLGAASSYRDNLPFELVDLGVDYGEFKGLVTVWEAGSKQNFKISTLLNHVNSMLANCIISTSDEATIHLNQSHMFKMCLKRLFKKLSKLYQQSGDKDDVIFMPELISAEALSQFRQKLDKFKQVKVCTLVTCPNTISQLKHSVDFGGSMIYTLGFTD